MFFVAKIQQKIKKTVKPYISHNILIQK